MDGVRIRTEAAEGDSRAATGRQVRVETLDGVELLATKATVHLDPYDAVIADVTLLLSEVDVVCHLGELTARLDGKLYRLVPVDEET